MASIEESFVVLLAGVPGFAAVVGDRLYPDRLPQNVVYPAAVYSRISTVRETDTGGLSGMQTVRLQLGAYGPRRAELQAAIEAAVVGLTGTRGVVAGIELQAVMPEDQRSFYEDDPAVYSVQADFMIQATQ